RSSTYILEPPAHHTTRTPLVQPHRQRPPSDPQSGCVHGSAGPPLYTACSGSDESLVSTKSCRDALFVHVQSGKHIILPGNKCLASHRSASLIQWLKFQPLYLLLSTRGEPQHPS